MSVSGRGSGRRRSSRAGNIREESIARLNVPLHLFLWTSGVLICSIVMMESYLQINKAEFTFLELAHQNGFLLDYTHSVEPNRGIWHNVGYAGSACFILMMLYSVRKRVGFLMNFGSLRSWLDVHMFLGIVGSFLITAHTTMKIGGLVAVSYWSMVIVATSGLIGRYLYGWIPHRISGKEVELEEIRTLIENTDDELERLIGRERSLMRYYERVNATPAPEDANALALLFRMFIHDIGNTLLIMKTWLDLATDSRLPYSLKRRLFRLIRKKNSMIRSRNFLHTSQRLLHYWHVFHKPLAFTMFIVMFLHIAVYFVFRVHV